MGHWKRIVAILLVAAVVLVLESWTVHATPTLCKNCTYECGGGRPGTGSQPISP
ncbi:hypothetical protein ACFVWG_38200 [Kribbella sp. NPDC058245]|uniref:hypothetical protein n=1 Tax=Kribbella sp. NPDC058245 TaxID=3346399 RepID=UPI0036F0A779